MTKRARLALRELLASSTGALPLPRAVMRQLEGRGFVLRALHEYERHEWGKLVERLPVGVLTESGRVAALELVEELRVAALALARR